MRPGLVFSTHGFLKTSMVAAAMAGLTLIGVQVRAESDRDYCERQQGGAKVVCMRQLEKAEQQLAKAATGVAAPSAQAESDRAYCERQQGAAKVVCMRQLDKAEAAPKAASTPAATNAAKMEVPVTSPAKPANASTASTIASADLYKVVDGYHVDAGTLKGFKVWRSAACDRCHGANQEGMVGPSLIESLKTLSKAAFVETVTLGRLQKGMPSFGTNSDLTANIDHLYAYLKGRSDGAITRSHVEPMQ